MKVVGVRALKQNASAVVAEAAAGGIVTITDRGRPVAQLVPLPDGHLASLIEAGLARPPKRSLAALAPALKRKRSQPKASEVLAQLRAEERY